MNLELLIFVYQELILAFKSFKLRNRLIFDLFWSFQSRMHVFQVYFQLSNLYVHLFHSLRLPTYTVTCVSPLQIVVMHILVTVFPTLIHPEALDSLTLSESTATSLARDLVDIAEISIFWRFLRIHTTELEWFLIIPAYVIGFSCIF